MYDQQILSLLSAVGERGISIAMLVKHIYNMNVTLFSKPDLQEVKKHVQQYLLRNSKSAHSLVESTGRRGYYRLNKQGLAYMQQQLVLDFQGAEADAEPEDENQCQDLSLSLFADSDFSD